MPASSSLYAASHSAQLSKISLRFHLNRSGISSRRRLRACGGSSVTVSDAISSLYGKVAAAREAPDYHARGGVDERTESIAGRMARAMVDGDHGVDGQYRRLRG